MTDQPNDKSAPKSPVEAVVEHAVETFVYAPIGLLFEGASLLPQLVEKGRSQVTMARMLGKFAVDQGRAEATKVAGKLQDQAAGVLELIGGGVTPPNGADSEAAAPRPAGRPPAHQAPKTPGAARAAARQVAGATKRPTTPSSASNGSSAPSLPGGGDAAAAPTTTDLAIPDYDGLSASHVVNRLAGLSASELEAVRRYEAANRGRKTILSKVAQLQAS